MLFTKMTATIGFIFIPISVFGNTPTLTMVLRVDLIQLLSPMSLLLPCPEVLTVVARTHVPANPTTGQLEVLPIVGSALVPAVLACAVVPETLAQPPLQHDLHGIFQQRLAN